MFIKFVFISDIGVKIIMVLDPNGRFQDIRQIGSGGFATVYSASDTVTSTRVALKVPTLDNPSKKEEIKARFEREAFVLEMLSVYPGFLSFYGIYDVKRSTMSRFQLPAIAMELLNGKDISSIQKRNGYDYPLKDRMVLPILLKVASDLDRIHSLGIVHRDIKPTNIIIEDSLTDPFECRNVRLIDFGLSGLTIERTRFLGQLEERLINRSNPSEITLDGTFIGTPEYAAPEIADGVNDQRSDLYSLGVVLFRMLTGKLPHYSKNRMNLFYKAGLPNPMHPDKVRKGIHYSPSRFSGICMELLQADPRDRYQSAKNLISDLPVLSN